MAKKEYGPYKAKDDRYRLVEYDEKTHKTTTKSYPLAIIEKQLGHKIGKGKSVDHKDSNVENNKPSNLQIMDVSKQNDQGKHNKKEHPGYLHPEAKNEVHKKGKKK